MYSQIQVQFQNKFYKRQRVLLIDA